MSETGDRLRALFEEIAPPLDVRVVMAAEAPLAGRRSPGWVIAAAAAGIVLLGGGGWLLFLRGRVETPSMPVTTIPAVATTGPEASVTSATESLVVPLEATGIRCSSGSEVLLPCDELIDGDPATVWLAPAGGAAAQITVYFEPPVRLFEVTLRNATDPAVFRRNARIASVDVSALDLSQAVHLSLQDTAQQQALPIGFTALFQQAGVVILRVTESYPGESYRGQAPQGTLALADIEFRGWEVTGSSAVGTTSSGPTVTTFVLGQPVQGEWSESSLPCCGPSGYVRDLLWDGEQFLALARHPGDASVWRSEDGLTWEEVAYLGDFTTLEGPGSLDHGAAGYLAGGSAGDMATVWYSSDGAEWAQVTLGPGGVGDVAVTSDGLVAVGTSQKLTDEDWRTGELTGVGMVWTSADGLTWQVDDLELLTPLPVYSGFSDVHPLGERLVATGSFFDPESDLLPLDQHRLVAVREASSPWKMKLPIGLTASQFDTTAVAHRLLAAIEGPVERLWTSRDGVTWQAEGLRGLVTQASGAFSPSALAGMGEVLVVAGGEYYTPPGEQHDRSDPAVWLREPEGTWRWAEGAPTLGAPGGIIYAAAASLDRVVLVLDHADGRLGIWVLRPTG